MNKRYRVTLTPDERLGLEQLLAKGKAAARKLTRARILLKADASPAGPAWTDDQIHLALDVGLATIARVRQGFVEQGLPATLTPRPRYRHRARELDGDQEAASGGPCGCWRTPWWSWAKSRRSRPRRCGRHSKKLG